MKKFDPNYVLLEEMYKDEYYPDFLVDKVEKGIILTAEELVYVNDFLRGCRRIIEWIHTQTKSLNAFVVLLMEMK